MEDYKAMYYTLFTKVCDVIEELQAIQIQTKELYIAAEEGESAYPE